jgi:hypothetical protein
MYIDSLDELITLLVKVDPLAKEWVRYFKESKALYESGNLKGSYKHLLGASGGMGSFDDNYWSNSLSESDQKRHEHLKQELRTFAQSKLQ